MVITSLRDDAMRNLRLAANSDCGGIGFRLLAYDFLQRTLLAKRISIDVYTKQRLQAVGSSLPASIGF